MDKTKWIVGGLLVGAAILVGKSAGAILSGLTAIGGAVTGAGAAPVAGADPKTVAASAGAAVGAGDALGAAGAQASADGTATGRGAVAAVAQIDASDRLSSDIEQASRAGNVSPGQSSYADVLGAASLGGGVAIGAQGWRGGILAPTYGTIPTTVKGREMVFSDDGSPGTPWSGAES